MKKYTFIIGAFLAIPCIFFAYNVHALELSPVFFDLVAKPGDHITQTITLKNDTQAVMKLNYQIGIIETSTADGKSAQLLSKPTDINTIADWITIETPSVTLKSGDTKKIPYTIDVPKDATPGGHYAWISYTENASVVTGSRVAISSGIATQILMRIEGDVKEALTLQSFQTKSGMSSFEKLPITFVAHVFNEGTTHQRPTGTVEIKNMVGAKMATLPFNNDSEGGNVLPKTGRSYETTWDKGFAFGKYTAHLDAIYSNGKHLTGQTSVWILPKALIIVWVLIFIIIIMLVIRAGMRISQRNLKRSPKKKI